MRVHRNKLEILRARLILHRGRNVEWQELARLCSVTPNTICNLRAGRSAGSMETVDKIVLGLRAVGLDVSREDLVAP